MTDFNTRHELRTPIRMILGFCEALLAPAQSLSAPQRADIEAIRRNAQQLGALIDTLNIGASPAAQTPVATGVAQLIVLDSDGSVYELIREYVSGYQLIRVSSVEEIGRLGQDVKPAAVIAGAGDNSRIPLLMNLLGKAVPILMVNLQMAQRRLDYLMKPVQFSELENIIQQLDSPLNEVLIVDDSRDNVDLLSRMLRSLTLPPRIIKAYSGREALALLDSQHPDLILMDFVLPDMDGMAIRDTLSLDTRLAHIPIVFVSAYNRPDLVALSGVSKLTLYQMTSVSPVKLAQQLQTILSAAAQ